MGKLKDKASIFNGDTPSQEMTNEERQARAKRLHPQLFIAPTAEERLQRLEIAEAAAGCLTHEQAQAIRQIIQEGRDALCLSF